MLRMGVAVAVISIFALVAVQGVVGDAGAEDVARLREIQKAIEERGAEWQAGFTAVSNLSSEEKKRLCGLKFREEEQQQQEKDREVRVGEMGRDPRPRDANAMTAGGKSPGKILRSGGGNMPPFASPGEVLASFTAPNSWVWGVGFDGLDVWISDPWEIWNYEYTTTGTLLSDFATPWAGAWPGDFAWNSNTGTLWQVNVGGDNCTYELDPATGTVVDTICDPDGIWTAISQRGLAYDAGTDTFYVGGWNDGIVYHIQGPTGGEPGKIIDQFDFDGVAGLAFAPDGTLWIGTNSCPDMLYQVDLTNPTNPTVIQCFAHPEFTDWWCFVAGGLACDGAGNLWMVSQGTNTVYYVHTSGAPAYPNAFDWRDNSGDWTTSIKDQEACGSCWAHGSLATMESWIDILKTDPTVDKDLSEQYLLSCSDGGDCEGWFFDSTMDFLTDTGTVDEACFPYQADDTIPCSDACDDADCRMWQITDWDWVPLSTWEIQGHLLDAPIVTGMPVYEDFLDYAGGVYEHVWGDLEGYHMVSMVGYNDDERYWICKNSWGTDWGETADFKPFTPGAGDGGWFRIGYGECEIETENAYIVPPITESIMRVNKTVFDETTGEWVDKVVVDAGETVRFRIFIPNPCKNLTAVEVFDLLSDGFAYAGSATVNGVACEPEEVVANPDGTTTLKWRYNAAKPCTEPFQELEVAESLTIEFDARMTKACLYENCANATAYCAEYTPPEQIFAHGDCAEVVSWLLYEDFEGTFPPVGWTVVDNLGGPNPVWERNDDVGEYNWADGGYCAIADSDYYEYDPMNTDLVSPVVDCSDFCDVTLLFDTDFWYSEDEWANVLVRSSATGGAWVNVLAWNEEDHPGPLTVSLDISAYADQQPDLQIRFNYDTKGEEWLWWWEVDNVLVCGTLRQPGINIEKWVKKEGEPESAYRKAIEDAEVCENVTFKIAVHNNGTNSNLTNILVTDELSASLGYQDNAEVQFANGTTAAMEPVQTAPGEYKWAFPREWLEPCEFLNITFDAHVDECGNDTNFVRVTAESEEGSEVADEDTVWVNCTVALPTPVQVETATGTGLATLETTRGNLEDVKAVGEDELPPEARASLPPVEFPHGFFEFRIRGLAPGQSVEVIIELPFALSPDSEYWKYGPTSDNPTDHWYEFMFDGTTGAEINGRLVTLHFVDGKRGDDDLAANGEIVDQGGPGNPPPPPVPEFSAAGVLALVGVLSIVVAVATRLRKRE